MPDQISTTAISKNYNKCCLDDCCLYQPVKWVAAGLRSIEKIPEDLQKKQWVKLAFDIAKFVLAVLAMIAPLFVAGFISTTLTFPWLAVPIVSMTTVAIVGEIFRQSADENQQSLDKIRQLGIRIGYLTRVSEEKKEETKQLEKLGKQLEEESKQLEEESKQLEEKLKQLEEKK